MFITCRRILTCMSTHSLNWRNGSSAWITLCPLGISSCQSYEQSWKHASWCRQGIPAREVRHCLVPANLLPLSLIAVDQGHEQNNGVLKDEGGIIGLTKDVAALLKWAVTGPELVRVSLNLPLWQIEKVLLKVLIMNEPTNATQKRFVSQVNALVDVLKSMGSPFEEESDHLVRLQHSWHYGSWVPKVKNILKSLWMIVWK